MNIYRRGETRCQRVEIAGLEIVLALSLFQRVPRAADFCIGQLTKRNGDPGKTRTSDTQFRKLLLYPPELRGHV